MKRHPTLHSLREIRSTAIAYQQACHTMHMECPDVMQRIIDLCDQEIRKCGSDPERPGRGEIKQ